MLPTPTHLIVPETSYVAIVGNAGLAVSDPVLPQVAHCCWVLLGLGVVGSQHFPGAGSGVGPSCPGQPSHDGKQHCMHIALHWC